MTTATDPNKLAAALEAETLERAGAITFSQARQRIRDGKAGPGAGSSDDAPFGEAQRGEEWPFPQGDGAAGGEGGDAGGDAAEFEAGAAAALAKSGVAPRGRRGRKTAGAVE